jgi:hypothetical protein
MQGMEKHGLQAEFSAANGRLPAGGRLSFRIEENLLLRGLL